MVLENISVNPITSDSTMLKPNVRPKAIPTNRKSSELTPVTMVVFLTIWRNFWAGRFSPIRKSRKMMPIWAIVLITVVVTIIMGILTVELILSRHMR